ncbi:hypothetical protein M0Q50_04420 [bacterium]|jgi:DNA-directed RNA polymerase subunit RPC12/RpoP|nr:hypothetical protein [bacterium]
MKIIKIIKKGNIEPKSIKEKCSKCKTVFEYTNADVKPDFRDGDYVECPVCGSFISAKRTFGDIIIDSISHNTFDRSRDC